MDYKSTLFDIFLVVVPLSVIFFYVHQRVHKHVYETGALLTIAVLYLLVAKIIKRQLFHDPNVTTLDFNDAFSVLSLGL